MSLRASAASNAKRANEQALRHTERLIEEYKGRIKQLQKSLI